MQHLLRLADGRPISMAALSFSIGFAALLVSVPPITEDLTPPPSGAGASHSHR